MKPTTIAQHLSVDEVARRLGMSTRWVRERIRLGEMAARRLGHRLLVPEDKLAAFLAARDTV